MVDYKKLDEIKLNNETINMMKELNMSNEEMKTELKDILTEYPEELVDCLIDDLTPSLFQSILLRLKLSEKLKMNNDKLLKSFNRDVVPLVTYILSEGGSIPEPVKEKKVKKEKKEKKVVIVEPPPKEETEEEEEEEEPEEPEDDDNESNVNEYIEKCLITSKNTFTTFEDMYDDYEQWVEQNMDGKKYESEEDFTKLVSNKFGKITTKNKKKGWKDVDINVEDEEN